MVDKKIIYVLEGAWNTEETDGCEVIKVSNDLDLLKNMLSKIIENKADDYVPYWSRENTYITEDIMEFGYDIRDEFGGWAAFYITEHEVCLEK